MNNYPYNREPITHEGMISSVYNLPFYEQVDVQKMIQDAYDAGQKKIVIPRGAYRINPIEKGTAHILLKDMSDFVVEGENGEVVLVCQDYRKNAVSLVNCDTVRVEGIATDFEPCGFFQCEVIGFDDGNEYFDVHIEEGYQCFFSDHDWTPDSLPGDFYDGETHDFMKGMRGTGYISRDIIEEIGDRTFRIHFPLTNDQRNRIKNGDFYCLSCRPFMRSGLTLSGCSHCVIRNFKVWAGLCGVAESEAKKQTFFDHFYVQPGPRPYGATHDRVCATAADGCHMQNNFEGARIENSIFDHAGDDAVNFYGFFFRVADQLAPDIVVFAMKNSFEPEKGERFRIYTEATEKVGEACVLSAQALGEDYVCPHADTLTKNVGANTFIPRVYYKVQLDRPIEAPIGGWVNSVNRCGNGFIFRNNICKNLRPRGALIKASNGVVEGNYFYNIGTAGVQIRPEFDWLESGYSHNVVVRGNTFDNCGGSASAAVMVSGQRALDQTDIVIEDNTFIHNVGPELSLAEGKNIVVRDNHFGKERKNKNCPMVIIRTGDGIRFENNTFEEGVTPVAAGYAPQNITGIEPMFYTICSVALMTGKQGVDGWRFQFASIGKDDYQDYDTYVYSQKLQDGWWQGEEENYTHGCIRRWWFDTYMLPGEEYDCVKTFVCPRDGEIIINAASYIVGAPSDDGIAVSVRHNHDILFEELKFNRVNTRFTPIRTEVKKGDCIYFRVNKNGNAVNDGLDWNPTILYTK